MGKINWSRVILGGLLWDIVYGALVAIAVPNIIAPVWAAELGQRFQARLLPQAPPGVIAVVMIVYLLLGIFTLWLYAAIRPRYGPGPKTAIIAGLGVWFAGSVPLIVFLNAMGLFSARFVAIDRSTTLVMVVVATLVGAWQYKEEEGVEAAAPSPAAPEEEN